MAKPSAEDVAAAFPEAASIAKTYRDVFGDEVRLIYARNADGLEAGKLGQFSSITPSTRATVSALV